MHFKKIERTRNTKENKIGLSEMHNIFVAADDHEEKRKHL